MRKKEDFLVFGSPLIEEAEIDEVEATLRSGWIGTGPKVNKFEQQFKDFKGTKFSIALNSCTAALHLSLLSIGIQPGDEVLVPTMTFCATVNAIIHAGGKPVFVDCDKFTMNIDPDDIERKLSPRTKAIVPVHFAGRPCAMERIMMVAKQNGLRVVEDCAHAIEAEYHGKKTGTFGDLGCFSFYVTKNIVTGEGGMVITDNGDYADKIKILALHGMSKDAWKRFGDEGYKHYQVVSAGFKYNMMDIQAALGLHQLKRIDDYWLRRQAIWKKYDQAFNSLPCFIPPKIEHEAKHAYHLYTLLLDLDRLGIDRDQVLNELTKMNIGVGVHYLALHTHSYYAKLLNCQVGDFPNAEFISERTISLPLSPKLSDGDVNDVIEAVTDVLIRNKR